ncbi:hypothetical protein AUC43_19250 [Hymenobacter sedentarius]|uniref:Secretion system C-terminal sorting domain-containing protein n=1 Tax=Hymenobacter sedentarius TaxID=1411621 RepID=A0A0U4AU92_9BACT|nr:T9SS type A sorting domain-containing protein [Hymenobacter sedentarius]ALW87024.1 hypothetical protein AUC43_19250 [Hymenobacter sedentarius]
MLAWLLLLSTGSMAQKTSTSSGSSFSQYANEPGKEQWIAGALIPNNSQYYEGTSTLQRLVLVNIPANPAPPLGKDGTYHEMTLKVLATKAGVNAYDFVTGFDQAIKDYTNITGTIQIKSGFDPTSSAQRLALVTGASIPNPATVDMITRLFQSTSTAVAAAPAAGTYATKIATAVNGYDADSYPGFGGVKRGVQLYAEPNNPISGAKLDFLGYDAPDQFGDSYGLYKLSWTSASANLLVLAGGHLANSDNSSPYTSLWLGPNAGASNISGGPYHFKLNQLDGASLGNQDNQIQSGSITVFVAPCTLNDYTAACVGDILTYTGSSAAINPTRTWSITGDGEFVSSSASNATVITPGNVATVYVRAKSGPTGTYQVKVVTTATNFAPSTCTDDVTVNNVTAGAIAGGGTLCTPFNPDAFTSTTAGSGGGTISYKWQSSTTSATATDFADISGATSATYDAPAVTATTWFRRVATSTLNGVTCSDNSNVLTVTPNAITPGAIAGGGTLCTPFNPDAFTSTTAGSGGGTISYKWQSSTTSATATDFADISGATSATYDAPAVTATTWFRRVATSTLNNVACSDNSNVLAVTVNDVTAGVIAGSATGCSPVDATAFTVTTAATGSGTLSYKWQSSTTSATATDFADISGATSATYDPGALTATTWFKRIATSTLNGVTCSATSNVLTVTVNAVPYRPVVTVQEALICTGTNTAPTITVKCSIEGTYHLTQGTTTRDITNPLSNAGNDLVITNIAVGVGGFSLTVTNANGCLSGATTCASTNTCAAQVYMVSSPSLPVGVLAKNIQTEAYPNPTGRDATINFSVPKSGRVVVEVYNAIGAHVVTLFDGEVKAGENQSVTLKGASLQSGTYTYRVIANGSTKSNRISLIK